MINTRKVASVQGTTPTQHGKSIVSELIREEGFNFNLAVEKFDFFDVLGIRSIKFYNKKESDKLSTILDSDFKESFKTIQGLVNEGLLDEELRIAEGVILINGCNFPIQHCWIIDTRDNSLIDPILSKLNLDFEKVNYFIGTSFGVDDFTEILDWGNYPIGTNQLLTDTLANEYNLYNGRMEVAMIDAINSIISNLNSSNIIDTPIDIISKNPFENVLSFSKKLHELN